MATIPRSYILTRQDNVNNIDPKNGQVIACYDADEVWYDASASGSTASDAEDLVRRKISSVKVVSSLPEDASDRVSGIVYILTDTGKTLPQSEDPVYEIYIWEETLNSWQLVGNNYGDEHVKAYEATNSWLTHKPIYLAGGTEWQTDVNVLLKSPYVYINCVDNYVTLHAPRIQGLASHAALADEAVQARTAEKDTRDQNLTKYVYAVRSDYSSGDYTTLTVTDGTGTETDVKIKDTRYDVFDATTNGLVGAPNDTVAANKLLTNTGWVAKGDISIGTADKATGDKNGKDITTYIADVTRNDSTSPSQLIFTRGNNVQVPVDLYGRFTTSADGLVPKASGSGDTSKFLMGNATWQALPVFNGPTAGIVPTVGQAADATKYLAGDGTWKAAFGSAVSGTNGTTGLVPAPTQSDLGKVLSNEGWVVNGTGAAADTDPANPIYLVGSKARNAGTNVTYTQDNVYAAEGKLYQSNGATAAQVVDVSSAQILSNKQFVIDGENFELGTASAYPAAEAVYLSGSDDFVGDGTKTVFNLEQDAASINAVSVNDVPTTDYTFVECENYDDEATYDIGDYCIYTDSSVTNIYRCSTTISTPEEWTPGHWTLVISDCQSSDLIIFNTAPANDAPINVDYSVLNTSTIPTSDAIAALLNNTINALAEIRVDNRVIAPYYNETQTYAVGSYCMFKDIGDEYTKLYKCTTAVSAPEDFDSTKWTETTIMQEILNH